MNKKVQLRIKGIYWCSSRLMLYTGSLICISVLLFSFTFDRTTHRHRISDGDVAYTNETLPIAGLPVQLRIPAIEVDALIQYVGLDSSGTGEMGVPDNVTDVGWFEPGIRPGMTGSAVIAGHYNGRGVLEGVFFELQTLTVGDEVLLITEDGLTKTFLVVRVERYDFDAPATEVFLSTDGKKRLNLITCSGVWLPKEKRFDKRTVVFTELVGN